MKCKLKLVNARIVLVILYLALTFGVSISCSNKGKNDQKNSLPIEVYFSPGDDCAGKVVELIKNSKNQILIQSYSFTSVPIATALIEACKRNVEIMLIADESRKPEKGSQIKKLKESGIAIFMDAPGDNKIAHNKVMILDNEIVITGSFNWTNAASKNVENIVVIKDPKIATVFKGQWESRRLVSKSI